MEKKIEDESTEKFIKKTSLNFYLLIKEIENNNLIDKLEAKKIIDKISKFDKDILNHFNIKFSEKQKNEGFKFLDLMKK